MEILFVCTGNICRSPTAQGLLSSLLEKQSLHHVIKVDSAGTHAHAGSSPDQHAQDTARQHGIDISHLRSRRLADKDFDEYNYIVAMGKNNLQAMLARCREQHRYKLSVLPDYIDDPSIIATEVPDPYGLGMDGFATVYDLIEQGCIGLLSVLQKEIGS